MALTQRTTEPEPWPEVLATWATCTSGVRRVPLHAETANLGREALVCRTEAALCHAAERGRRPVAVLFALGGGCGSDLVRRSRSFPSCLPADFRSNPRRLGIGIADSAHSVSTPHGTRRTSA